MEFGVDVKGAIIRDDVDIIYDNCAIKNYFQKMRNIIYKLIIFIASFWLIVNIFCGILTLNNLICTMAIGIAICLFSFFYIKARHKKLCEFLRRAETASDITVSETNGELGLIFKDVKGFDYYMSIHDIVNTLQCLGSKFDVKYYAREGRTAIIINMQPYPEVAVAIYSDPESTNG